jgi:hypothetical protein
MSDTIAKLRGYAIVVDELSADMGFRERIARQAVERALARRPDVLALVDHDPSKVIGRTSSGTLRLALDRRGLLSEIDVPATSHGRDVVASVRRHDTRGMSFAFSVPEGGELWDVEGEDLVRTVVDMVIHDVTVTAIPAYPATSVDVVGHTDDEASRAAQMAANWRRLRLAAL